VEPAAYLDAIRRESAAFVDAAEAAGIDAPVPSCPDWRVGDLLGHIGQVQGWQADIVERRATEAEFRRPDPPADRAARADWVRDSTARLLDVFTSTPPDTPMWTFVGPGTAAFWFRRQAHEVTMHRVDADLAAGALQPIEPELARDAIDEFFDIVVTRALRDRYAGDGETLHLHCTDGDGEWLVRLSPEGPEVERAHAKGDVAVRGTASDLLLAVRSRTGLDSCEVFGDERTFTRFRDLSRF
jgi:uncharacterized protein (TIGR03083 family)